MYDQRDTNGTELRAVSGNFLFSTGANEFAGRYTAGHFDLPMMGTTIELDGTAVVREGVSLQQLVDGLNALGIGPRDLIAILQAIKAAGAIQAEIEVM